MSTAPEVAPQERDIDPARRRYSVLALVVSIIPVALITAAVIAYSLPFSTTGGWGESVILFGALLLLAVVTYPVCAVLVAVFGFRAVSKKHGNAPRADKVLVVVAVTITVASALYGLSAIVFSLFSS